MGPPRLRATRDDPSAAFSRPVRSAVPGSVDWLAVQVHEGPGRGRHQGIRRDSHTGRPTAPRLRWNFPPARPRTGTRGERGVLRRQGVDGRRGRRMDPDAGRDRREDGPHSDARDRGRDGRRRADGAPGPRDLGAYEPPAGRSTESRRGHRLRAGEGGPVPPQAEWLPGSAPVRQSRNRRDRRRERVGHSGGPRRERPVRWPSGYRSSAGMRLRLAGHPDLLHARPPPGRHQRPPARRRTLTRGQP